MSKSDNVIELVVENNLCIGCGMCTYKNEENLKMISNDEGFLIPELINNKNLSDNLNVCPFNPNPEKEIKTENEIAEIFLKDAKNYDPKIGRYNNLYVGSVEKYIKSSSSGGLATFVLVELLENKHVNHVISVKESITNSYEYSISSNSKDLIKSSKTRYYPVTLATIINKIELLDGKVAIVGVGCFIKSLRLAQYYHPELREKIGFLVGIICGGIKSRFFTEYLAGKTGTSNNDYKKAEYRIKDFNSSASDYSFGVTRISSNEKQTVKMRSVGDMWGSGLFKANACDFCDDVTTELADISLGDAWMQPYVSDGKGTSIIVTRSKLAEKIIQSAITNQKVQLENLTKKAFLNSQKGSFNHRQQALPFRYKLAKINGKIIPPIRYKDKNISALSMIIQLLRSKSRSKSLKTWKKNQNIKYFDREMKMTLSLLKIVTIINRKIRSKK